MHKSFKDQSESYELELMQNIRQIGVQIDRTFDRMEQVREISLKIDSYKPGLHFL